jgi:hypothetical protein
MIDDLFLTLFLLGAAAVRGWPFVAAPGAPPTRPARPGAGEPVCYRTRDGQADYTFVFLCVPQGCYRIYILTQPGYGWRATDVHSTHRLMDQHGTYICWSGAIRTEEQARAVAALWADKTQEYIRTGTRF